MASYDGAKICEIVGLSILSILGKSYGVQNVVLYRKDGLACFHKISGPVLDRIWKDINRIWRGIFGLKTTIATNLRVANFLDVSFDLCTGRYQPYKKPNDTLICINVSSSHTPNIMKALPDSISKRISNISSDKATFSNAADFYNALFSSGYKEY